MRANMKSKKYFIDTEFIESGSKHPLELISIGIVCDDGREYYAAVENPSLDNASPWVMENVIEHLDWSDAKSRDVIRDNILNFIEMPNPIFYGYFADYDWILFCQLFGTMMDLPNGFPKFCMDLKQFAVLLGNPELPKLPNKTEHHALWDAREMKFRYDWLLDKMKCSCNGWGRIGDQLRISL
jgi:hypothetical protein